MALATSFFADSLARCLRSHVSNSVTSERLRSLRTRCRSGGGLPLMARSIANSASMRSTASIAIGALLSRARSKNLRRACARQLAARHRLPIAENDGAGADPRKEFSGVASCFDGALKDVVAWQQ